MTFRSSIEYLKHVWFNLWNMHKKAEQWQKLERKHKKQGVLVYYYRFFKVRKGVFLPSAKIEKPNAWSMVSFKPLTRKARRIVEANILGSSKFEKKNEFKMKMINIQTLINNKRKRLLKRFNLFKL